MPVLFMEKSSIEALSETDIKKLIDSNIGDMKYSDLKDYYVGKHSILSHQKKDGTAPNNKIVNNMAKYVTDTAVGYFVGKPIVYSSQNEEQIKKVQSVFEYNDEQDHNIEIAKMNSIYGSCFEMLYLDEDANIRFVKIEPSNLIMIYETGYSSPVAAIRLIHSKNQKGESVLKAEFWDANDCWHFKSVNSNKLDLLEIIPHYWGDIPFVEYINNEERLGDFEGIIDIVDSYNKVQSNTANLFQYNDEAILKVMKLGDVNSNDIKDMKEKGAVILEDGGDIEWLLKQINDTALENFKRRLREDMHIFSNVPNMTDEAFGGNLSGVAVSYKLWGLEQICAMKERKFKRGLQRRIELITNILNIKGGNYNYMDIDIQFRRNKPQNLLELAQIITMLSSELSKETRLGMFPTIENVQDELDRLAEERKTELNDYGNLEKFAKAFDTSKPQVEEEVLTDEQPR